MEKALRRSEEVLNQLEKFLLDYSGDFNDAQSRIKEVRELKEKARNYAHKLETGELEVAFAGLEKSGKSTFVNAFISKNILPTASERTTYTITELRYNSQGKVTVYFYTEQEFNNEIFQKLLARIEYPNYESASYITFSNQVLESHINYLKSDKQKQKIFEQERSTTIKDIKDIIDGKEKIREYLGREKLEFEETDIEKYKPFITDPYISRAAKNVLIHSPRLKELENVVIYDLPGFDSPTFMHSKFTKDTLRKADAVVFIRKMGQPSLTGPEIDILNGVQEEDNVFLREKTFFFLNQADVEKTENQLRENKEKFIAELNKYGLFQSRERVVIGSSLAHLAHIGVLSTPESKRALDDLKRVGIEDTGIEKLRDELVKYNNTVRKSLLERRAKAVINNILELLDLLNSEINQKLGDIKHGTEDMVESYIWLNNAKDTIKRNLDKLQKEYKETIPKNHPLSNAMKEKVAYIASIPDKDVLEEIKLRVESLSPTTEQRPENFNWKVRECIREEISKKIRNISGEILSNKLKEAEDRICKEIANALSSNGYSEAILNKMKEFLKKEIGDITAEMAGYSLLVQRFTGDLIDLMMQPVNSADRENKFDAIYRDIYSLYAFYEYFDASIPAENSSFVKMIRYQGDIPDFEKIKSRFNELSGKFNIDNKGIDKIMKLLISKAPYNIDKFFDAFVRRAAIAAGVDPINIALEIIDNMGDSINKPKRPENYDEVLEEIKKDIEILKYVITTAVINAINMEKAFISFLTTYLEYIKSLVEEKKFIEFVIRNEEHIRPNEYTNRGIRILKIQQLTRIREEINKLFQQIKGGEQ